MTLAAFMMFAGLTGSASSQSFLEHQKVLASDGTTGGVFGRAVSVSDDRAIVGAPFGNNQLGAAYVFERDASGTWLEVQKLTASDGSANDLFGGFVSLSGDVALIGATSDGDNGALSGSAYVFERQTNGSWKQIQKLVPSDGAQYDNFGTVAVAGSFAIIGALGDGDQGAYSGSAYSFRRQSDGTWTQTQKLLASGVGGHEYEFFGSSAAVSGNTALIGATEDFSVVSSGSAYVFELQPNGLWTQVAKLNASDGASGDCFGVSASVSDGRALVGSLGGPFTGSAYVFERQLSGAWAQAQKLQASDAAAGDLFGLRVSLSGDRALIGARSDDDSGSESGSAYLFERQPNGSWLQSQKLTASDGAAGDFFGDGVSLSADSVFIGAGNDDDNGPVSGSAYVFEVGSCAPDLGFRGPGNIELSVCGDDLMLPGSTAKFLVTQAPPSSIALLFVGLSNSPTPIPGTLGTVVPVPNLAGYPAPVPIAADGSLSFPVYGGSLSPITLYLQVLAQNGAAVEFSNAVQLSIGL